MKTLILSALVMVFGAQFAAASTKTECHQCHPQTVASVKIVREFR